MPLRLRSDQRRLWNDENMQKLTAALEQGGASIRRAGEKHGRPRSTLPIQATYHTFHTSYTGYLSHVPHFVYSLLTTSYLYIPCQTIHLLLEDSCLLKAPFYFHVLWQNVHTRMPFSSNDLWLEPTCFFTRHSSPFYNRNR